MRRDTDEFLTAWLPCPSFPGVCATRNGDVKDARGVRVPRKNRRWRYLQVNVLVGGVDRTIYVHRLVGDAVMGPIPDGLETCHVDGDKENNAASNLAYVTHALNMQHAAIHKTAHRPFGNTGAAKLTEDQVRSIRRFHRQGETVRSLADWAGVSDDTIRRIIKRQSWAGVDG